MFPAPALPGTTAKRPASCEPVQRTMPLPSAAVVAASAAMSAIRMSCLTGVDVLGQILDLDALLLRLELDDVTDRDHADDVTVLGDGQVPDPLFGHQSHAFVDRRLRGDHDQRRRHDLANRGVAVGA